MISVNAAVSRQYREALRSHAYEATHLESHDRRVSRLGKMTTSALLATTPIWRVGSGKIIRTLVVSGYWLYGAARPWGRHTEN